MPESTNSYASLDEFQKYAVITTINELDDLVIIDLLESASRFIDAETNRTFYARTETRKFDVPIGSRTLKLDDDLLSITTLTNGDSAVILSSAYIFLPANETPKHSVKLKASSTVSWELSGDGDAEQAITILGSWGHNASGSHPEQIRTACLEITRGANGRRTGKNLDTAAQVTAAGVVLTPRDISSMASRIIRSFVRGRM